jgi:TolA-binding protein
MTLILKPIVDQRHANCNSRCLVFAFSQVWFYSKNANESVSHLSFGTHNKALQSTMSKQFEVATKQAELPRLMVSYPGSLCVAEAYFHLGDALDDFEELDEALKAYESAKSIFLND